jgi:hypothetical protein
LKEEIREWTLIIKKSMVGRRCEDIRCRRPFHSIREMQINHHVRRNHRKDLVMDRKNVSVCHKEHGSPEDCDAAGRHTTNSERLRIVELRYGSDAAERARSNMAEVGLLESSDPQIANGNEFGTPWGQVV